MTNLVTSADVNTMNEHVTFMFTRTIINLMRDRPLTIHTQWYERNPTNEIERMKRFGSQHSIECNDSKRTVCILIHSLYGLTGTGVAFHLEPHFIHYLHSINTTWTMNLTKANTDVQLQKWYRTMIVSTLWWHLFMIVPWPICTKWHGNDHEDDMTTQCEVHT